MLNSIFIFYTNKLFFGLFRFNFVNKNRISYFFNIVFGDSILLILKSY